MDAIKRKFFAHKRNPEGEREKTGGAHSGGEGGARGGEGAAAPSSPGEVPQDFGPKKPPPGFDLIHICPLTVQSFSLTRLAVGEKNAFKVGYKKILTNRAATWATLQLTVHRSLNQVPIHF